MSVVPSYVGFRRVWLSLGLYVLVLVGSPLAHHDLACHVKSPTHCDACQANPLVTRAEPAVRLDSWPAEVAGAVEAGETTAPIATVVAPVPGRSPPA